MIHSLREAGGNPVPFDISTVKVILFSVLCPVPTGVLPPCPLFFLVPCSSDLLTTLIPPHH